MKRLHWIAALALMAALPLRAERVKPETAQRVAQTFLNNNGAKANHLADLSKTAGYKNLYIFTAEQGFVVMAADDCAKPILGYSLTDEFAVNDMPDNLSWWLQQYDDEIQWGIENKIQPDESTASEWAFLKDGVQTRNQSDVVVGPLIATRWNQGSPYNLYCPSGAVTGCVATAMAQVMKYWNYPEQGQGSHSYTPEDHPEYGEQNVNFGETAYDWANMKNTYGSYTEAEAQAVATLMYHCGVSVDMNYGPNSSGAPSSKVATALVEYFKYSPSARFVSKSTYTEAQWKTFLKSELDEGRPLFYSGSNAESGHAFVCDGYRDDDYFHFNWGWGGYKDNYFAIGALNPSSGGIGSGSGTYNLNNAVAAWVEPVSNLAAPTISAEAANGIITLSWNTIADAETYDLYRDNVKIATGIAINQYIDNDIIPNQFYEYYLRSVSGSTRSNPSNRITKSAFYRDYTPKNLSATIENCHSVLTWAEPENNSATLQYATSYSGSRYGMGDDGSDTYWTEVFAPSRLADFTGMYIEKVSAYLYLPGTYTLLIYQDNTKDITNKLYEESFNVSSTGYGWKDIELSEPVLLDCTKNLWVIMHYPYTDGSSKTYWYPATFGTYEEILFDDEEDEECHNPRLIGRDMQTWYYIGNNISWLFKTYLTDGTYTYNIYDGTTKLNSEVVTETTFTHENPASNTTHQYTVTTNYYGGESAASNMASVALGSVSTTDLELQANDQMTVAAGSTLTVSGTFTNTDPHRLILENGAQLIHNRAGVKATMKKDIAPYATRSATTEWNFIASPVIEDITPSADNGLLAGTYYDLYYYDEPTHYWMNHKKSPFAIEHKKGYLYANSATTELGFEGTLLPSNGTVTISNLSHSAEALNGFNLVGNPFACNATVDKDFYVINEAGDEVVLAAEGRQIAPMEGVFVKATSDNATVTFSRATSGAKGNGDGKSLDLVVTQEAQAERGGASALDRVRVRLGEGTNMEKFSLNDDHAQLGLWHGGQDYAVAYADGVSELPVSFKAAENGTYTIGIEANTLGVDYLHLIDNLTGADIDLLSPAGSSPSQRGAGGVNQPVYTFQAKTTDYESRFKLVFVCGDANDDNDANGDGETFAFITNGEIHLLADAHDASLQVIDAMGRVVVSVGGHTRSVPTAGMTAGIYILRLIDGETVRTQKIVIE